MEVLSGFRLLQRLQFTISSFDFLVEQTVEEDEIGFVDLVSSAAKRVWDVFYQQKKDVSHATMKEC